MEPTSHLGPRCFRFCAAPTIIHHLLQKLRPPPIPYELACKSNGPHGPPRQEPADDCEPLPQLPLPPVVTIM